MKRTLQQRLALHLIVRASRMDSPVKGCLRSTAASRPPSPYGPRPPARTYIPHDLPALPAGIEPVATDEPCTLHGCPNLAAFTRNRVPWCHAHIESGEGIQWLESRIPEWSGR